MKSNQDLLNGAEDRIALHQAENHLKMFSAWRAANIHWIPLLNNVMNDQEAAFLHELRDKSGNLYQIQMIKSKEESNKVGEKLADLKKINSTHELLATAINSVEKYKEMQE